MSEWNRAFKALYHFDSLDSTQTYLHTHPKIGAVFCRANTQTAGKGQRERVWHAPRGQLYFSLQKRFDGDYADLQGLTQAVALSLVESLDPAAKQLRLKWPNDVYLNGQKLAGILLESEKSLESEKCDKALWLTLGIGINLTPHQDFAGLQSLPEFCDATPDSVLNQIMPALLDLLDTWQVRPYLPMNHRFHAYDAFFQRKALCEQLGEVVLQGIDQRGRLCVQAGEKIQFVVNTRILSHVSVD